MISARSLKKTASLVFTVVYLQVNVAWAGVPTLPLFSFPSFGLKQKDVIVFHGYDDDFIRRQNNNRRSETGADKVKESEKTTDPIRKGRYENNKEERKVETPKVAALNADVLNKSPDLAGTIDTIVTPLGQDRGIKNQLNTLLQKAANNGDLTIINKSDLSTINKILGEHGLKVEVVKSMDGTPKLEVQRVPATVQLPQTPAGQIPANILANVVDPASLRETPVRAAAGNSNFGAAIRQAGFDGNIADINRGSIQIENGTRLVRTDDGVRFVGKASFTTNNGIKVTIEGNAAGRVTINKQATRDATFVEVGRGNKPVAQTIFKAGDSETRVNGTLTHFEAKSGAITREVLVKPARGAGNGTDVKPGELRGSIGDYVVREGKVDSTFRMVNNKVTLTEIKDNLTGATLAKLHDGVDMKATAAGIKAGFEPTFKVTSGPTFDASGSMQLKAVTTHQQNETRTLTVEAQSGPKNQRAGGGAAEAGNYKDVTAQFKNIDRQGNTTIQVKADADGAQMEWNLTSNGMRLSQNVTGENMRYLDAGGNVIAHSIDGVKLKVDDGQQVRTTNLKGQSMVMTTDPAKVAALKSIGVEPSRILPSMPGVQNITGEIAQAADGTRTMDVTYHLNNNATANFVKTKTDLTVNMNTTAARGDTAFNFGSSIVTVQENKQVPLSLQQNRFLEVNNSFAHLDGVRLSNDGGDVTLTYDQQTRQVNVGVDVLANGGRNFFGGTITVQNGKNILTTNTMQLSDQAHFSEGKVWFALDKPVTLEHQTLVQSDQTRLTDMTFTGHQVSFGFDGVKTLSSEVMVTNTITVNEQKGGSGSLATPGATSDNITLDATDQKTVIQNSGNGPARVAAIVEETDVFDVAGRSISSVRFNPVALGSTNITAGQNGFDVSRLHVGANATVDISARGEVTARSQDLLDARITSLTNGHTFDLMAGSEARFANGSLVKVEHGKVRDASPGQADIAKLNFPGTVQVEVKQQRIVEHTAVESTEIQRGQVFWRTTGRTELETENKSKVAIDAGMVIETREASVHSLAQLPDAIRLGITSIGGVRGGNGKLTVTDPTTTDAPEGLSINIIHARQISLDRTNTATIDVKGEINFVAGPNGYKNLETNGSGVVVSANARFTAERLNFEGMKTPEAGRVDFLGRAVNEKFAFAMATNGKELTATVTVQGRTRFEAGTEGPVQRHEVLKMSAMAGDVYTMTDGATLTFEKRPGATQINTVYSRGIFDFAAGTPPSYHISVDSTRTIEANGTDVTFLSHTSFQETSEAGVYVHNETTALDDNGIKVQSVTDVQRIDIADDFKSHYHITDTENFAKDGTQLSSDHRVIIGSGEEKSGTRRVYVTDPSISNIDTAPREGYSWQYDSVSKKFVAAKVVSGTALEVEQALTDFDRAPKYEFKWGGLTHYAGATGEMGLKTSELSSQRGNFTFLSAPLTASTARITFSGQQNGGQVFNVTTTEPRPATELNLKVKSESETRFSFTGFRFEAGQTAGVAALLGDQMNFATDNNTNVEFVRYRRDGHLAFSNGSPASFSAYGNKVTIDPSGKIQTFHTPSADDVSSKKILSAGEIAQREVVAFTSAGLQKGVYVSLEGKGNIAGAEGRTNGFEFTAADRKFALRVESEDGTSSSLHLTSDMVLRNGAGQSRFQINMGAVFTQNGDYLALSQATLTVRRGDIGFIAGSTSKVGVASGGSSSSEGLPSKVYFVGERNGSGIDMRITEGTAIVTSSKIQFTAGTLFINEKYGGPERALTNGSPLRLMMVTEAGGFDNVMVTAKNGDGIVADIQAQLKNNPVSDTDVESGKDFHFTILNDKTLRAVGSYSTTTEAVTKWLGMRNTGEVTFGGQASYEQADWTMKTTLSTSSEKWLGGHSYTIDNDGKVTKMDVTKRIDRNYVLVGGVRGFFTSMDVRDPANPVLESRNVTFSIVDKKDRVVRTLDVTRAANEKIQKAMESGDVDLVIKEQQSKGAFINQVEQFISSGKLDGIADPVTYLIGTQTKSQLIDLARQKTEGYWWSDLGKWIGVLPQAYADKFNGTSVAGETLDTAGTSQINNQKKIGGMMDKIAAASLGDIMNYQEVRARGYSGSTGKLGDQLNAFYSEASFGEGGWVDRKVGWFMGVERLAKAGFGSKSEVANFGLAVAEQTLNFFTLGGGGLLSGGAKATLSTARLGQTMVSAARAGEVGWAMRLGGQMLAQPLWRGAARGLQIYMRAEAFTAASHFVDVAGSSRYSAAQKFDAFRDAAWKMAVSEVGLVGPLVGKLANGIVGEKIAGALGFGATAASKPWKAFFRQTVTVAGAGAIIKGTGEVISGMLDGKSVRSILSSREFYRSMGGGFVTGAFAFGAYSALNKLGSWTGIGEKWLKLNANEAGSKIGRYLREFTVEVAGMGRNAVSGMAGATASNAYEKLSGGKFNGNWSEVLKQGAFGGFLVGGALQAMSKWGSTFEGMKSPGGIDAFNWARIESGASIAGYELVVAPVVNPVFSYVGGILGWKSPAGEGHQQMSSVGKFLSGFLGKSLAGHIDRALSSGLNIAQLHPFFSLGRVGKNPIINPIESGAGRLKQLAQENLKSGFIGRARAYSAAGEFLARFVAMPGTIKTFEAFEMGAESIATHVGLINDFKKDAQGNYTHDVNGQLEYTSDRSKAAHLLVRTLGFINAPISEPHSETFKELQKEIGNAAPRIRDSLPLVGKFFSKGGAERVAAAREWAALVRSAEGEGAAFHFTADGKTFGLTGKELGDLHGMATATLAEQRDIGKILAGREAPTLLKLRGNDVTEIKTDKKSGGKEPVMSVEAATQMVLTAQATGKSGKGIADARDVLGLAEGDLLIKADSNFIAGAQSAYVRGSNENELNDLIDGAADKTGVAPSMPVLAMEKRFNGDAAVDWVTARGAGIDAAGLKNLGRNWDKLVAENKSGDRAVPLGKGMSLSAEVMKKLPGKILDAIKNGSAELVLQGEGAIHIGGVSATDMPALARSMDGGSSSRFDHVASLFGDATLSIKVWLSAERGVTGYEVRMDNPEADGPVVHFKAGEKNTYVTGVLLAAGGLAGMNNGLSDDDKKFIAARMKGESTVRADMELGDKGQVVDLGVRGDDFSLKDFRRYQAKSSESPFYAGYALLMQQGKSAKEIRGDKTLEGFGQKLLADKMPAKQIADMRDRLTAVEAEVEKDPAAATPGMKDGIAALRDSLSRLEGKTKDPHVIELLEQTDVHVSAAEAFAGTAKMDDAKVDAMRAEIADLPSGNAKTALTKILDLAEAHVKDAGADESVRNKRFLEFHDLFSALLGVYHLDDLSTTQKGQDNKKALIGMMEGENREDMVHSIFGKTSDKLNVDERLALSLALSKVFFEKYDGIAPPTDDNGKIYNARQGALLVQFMLGRLGGLAAGGGKSPVFVMAFGEHLMKNRAEINKTGAVFELVVYAEGEVDKYLADGKYAPLFRAFGMNPVDGRGLADHQSKRAEEAYTVEAGQVNVVIADLHSRGFLERQLRNESDSALTRLVDANVKSLGLDEADALLLSRMSFISSDGKLVASKAEVSHIKKIADAVFSVMELDKPGVVLTDRETWAKYKSAEKTREEDVDVKDGNIWYQNRGGDILISDAMWTKIEATLKESGAADVTRGEIKQAVRALDAVGNGKDFGFARGENNMEANLRPTHKKNGEFSHGQIDSSITFNVAAVLFGRRALADTFIDGKTADTELSLDDIRLSDAGSMATFVQVLQRNSKNHRFGATGTPKALERLAPLVIGLKVVDVDPSNYKDYNRAEAKTIKEAYAYNRSKSDTKKEMRYIDIFAALKPGRSMDNLKAAMSGEAIMRSLYGNDRSTWKAAMENGDEAQAGILIGSRGDKDLISALCGYLTLNGAGDVAKEIRGSRFGNIRDAVEFATEKVKGNGRAEKAMARVQVIDGNRKSDTIVERAAIDKSVVFGTEVSLRGLSYDAKKADHQIDLLLMGTETFSTESNLQAFARVDRAASRGARRTILVDSSILRNQVESAQRSDEALKEKFGREDGLELSLGMDVKTATLKDLIERSGDWMSKQDTAQSALFFINEQIGAKLIKEPLADMIGREASPAGRRFLDDLRLELLKNSDKQNDIKQGTEYMDPRQIAVNAYQSGVAQAKSYLLRIANSKLVSSEIRLEASQRLADIIESETGFSTRMFATDAKGRHVGDQYDRAAFVGVSEKADGKAAQAVADVVTVLSELLLPNTQTSRTPAGATAEQRTTETMVHASRGQPGAQARVDDMAFAEQHARTPAPAAKTNTRLLSYHEQAIVAIMQTLNGMSDDEKNKTVSALFNAGLVDRASQKINTAPRLAVALVAAWNAAGGRDDHFDAKAILDAAVDLSSLSQGQAVSRADVVRVALAPASERREAVAQALQRRSDVARTVVSQTEQTRDDAVSIQNSSGISRWVNRAVAVFHAARRWMNDPAKTKLAEGGTDANGVTALTLLAGVMPEGVTRDKVKQMTSLLAGLESASPGLLRKISVKDVVKALNSIGDKITLADAVQTLVKNAQSSGVKKWLDRGATALASGGMLAFTAASFGWIAPVAAPVLFGVFGGAALLKIAGYDSARVKAANPLVDGAKKLWSQYKAALKTSPGRTAFTTTAAVVALTGTLIQVGPSLLGWGLAIPAINAAGAFIGKKAEAFVNKFLNIRASSSMYAIQILDDAKAESNDKRLTLGDIVKALNADKRLGAMSKDEKAKILKAALMLAGLSDEKAGQIAKMYASGDEKELAAIEKRGISELSDKKRSIEFFVDVADFEAGLEQGQALTPDTVDNYFASATSPVKTQADDVIDFYAGWTLSSEQRSQIRDLGTRVDHFEAQLTAFRGESKTAAPVAERRNLIQEISMAQLTGDVPSVFRDTAAKVLGENSQEYVAFSMLNFDASLTAQNQGGGLLFTGLTPEGHAVILQGAEKTESGMVLSVKGQDGQTSVGTITIKFAEVDGKMVVSLVTADGLNGFVPAVIIPGAKDEPALLKVLTGKDEPAFAINQEKKQTHVTFARTEAATPAEAVQAGPILTLPNEAGVVTPLAIPNIKKPEAAAMVSSANQEDAPVPANVQALPNVIMEDDEPGREPMILSKVSVGENKQADVVTPADSLLSPEDALRFSRVISQLPTQAGSPFGFLAVVNAVFKNTDGKNVPAYGAPNVIVVKDNNGRVTAFGIKVSGREMWVVQQDKGRVVFSKSGPVEGRTINYHWEAGRLTPAESLNTRPAAATAAVKTASASPSSRRGIANVAIMAVLPVALVATVALLKGTAAVAPLLAAVSAPAALIALPVAGVLIARTLMDRKKQDVVTASQSNFDAEINQGNYTRNGNTYWPASIFNRPYTGNEQIVLWQKQAYSVNGETLYVVKEGVQLRQNVLAADMDTITEPVKEMFSLLALTDIDPAVGPDRGAIRNVEQVLNHPIYGDVAQLISVEPFHLEQKLNVTSAQAPKTLGDVFTGNYTPEFKSFVYQMVAYNNQTLATPDSVAVQVDVIADYAEAYPGLIIQQINPGRGALAPSLHDDGAFLGLTDRLGAGHSINMVQTNQQDGTIVLFKPGEITPINKNSQARTNVVTPRTETPSTSVFQSLKNVGMSLLDRLFNITAEAKDPGQIAVARTALDAAYDIHFKHNLSPDQIKAVWITVGEYTVNKNADLKNIARGTEFEGMGVDQLVRELTIQMRELSARNPAVTPIAQRNAMPVLGLQVGHHFANVAAMPKSSILPWLASRMIDDIGRINLVGAKEANKRLKAIGDLNNDEIIGSLLSLAQRGSDESNKHLMPVIGEIVRGNNTEIELQESALKMIARGLDGDTNARIFIQDATTFDKRFKGGQAFIRGNYIYLRQDKETTFIDMAVALAHEMGHPNVEAALAAYPNKGAGVPTAIIEALTQGYVSENLRNAGHVALANALDKKIYQRIIDQEERGVVIFIPDNVFHKNKAQFEEIQRASQGLRHVVPMSAAMMSKKHLAMLASLASGDETPLETHGRLYFGTRNVSLMTTVEPAGLLREFVTSNGSYIDVLVKIVDAITLEKLNERFNAAEARLAASQA